MYAPKKCHNPRCKLMIGESTVFRLYCDATCENNAHRNQTKEDTKQEESEAGRDGKFHDANLARHKEFNWRK